jgi:P-type Mg2+ transporter
VLLDDDVGVIVHGVEEGRRIFTIINRYLLYTMVSNFANVMVVALASLFLPYLPLLPDQVLLLNILADLPMLAIITDRVAQKDLATPRRWDIRRLVKLTLFLGMLNAVFAFGLWRVLEGRPTTVIYSSWFLLLGTTALLILFAVRTTEWFWQAPAPSLPLVGALVFVLGLQYALVDIPATQRLLHFGAISWQLQLGIVGYSCAYLGAADVVKRVFIRHAEASA